MHVIACMGVNKKWSWSHFLQKVLDLLLRDLSKMLFCVFHLVAKWCFCQFSVLLQVSFLPGEDPSEVTDAAVHTLYREANKFALVSFVLRY